MVRRWVLTRVLAGKKGQKRLFRKLDEVRKRFPELDGKTIKVGSSKYADGKACKEDMAIWIRSRNASYYTIAHEMTHLIQGQNGIPEGEKACDIYALSRDYKFCDEAPNYLKIPAIFLDEKQCIKDGLRIMVHLLAKEAIDRRAAGHRNYIRWFENELERVAEILARD
jgi:hypothetical protein